MVQLLKLTKKLKNSFLAHWMCHWLTWKEVCAIMRLLKNLLIFPRYQRKLSHSLLLRKRLQGKSLLVFGLLPVVLHPLLMHMRSCFHPFLSSRALASYSSHQLL